MSQELADAIDTPGTADTAAAPAVYPGEIHWYDLPDDEIDDDVGAAGDGDIACDDRADDDGDPGDERCAGGPLQAGPREAGPRDKRDRRGRPRAQAGREGPV